MLLLILALEILALTGLPDEKLHLIACNVGQGDATLIIYKNTQILVDGGPDNSVMKCLGKYVPFWDREIELVVLTHPDSDHFSGLIGVLNYYKVDNYLANKLSISKPQYRLLENLVGRVHTNAMTPHKGQVISLGLIHLDILNPKIDQSSLGSAPQVGDVVTDESSNNFSIVSLVRFGKYKALLTGDMPPDVSDELAQNWSWGTLDYIKISHHGSKNGTTLNLLNATMPKLAVISVGKNNYGHPSQEILRILSDLKIKYLRTDQEGDIEVKIEK